MGYRPGEGLGTGITAPITEGGRMEKELQEYSSVSKRIMVCVCVFMRVCARVSAGVCVSHRYSQPVKQLISLSSGIHGVQTRGRPRSIRDGDHCPHH